MFHALLSDITNNFDCTHREADMISLRISGVSTEVPFADYLLASRVVIVNTV